MNRPDYFNTIEYRLSTLAYRISLGGKLNILDFHGHSENFYQYLLNEVYGGRLQMKMTLSKMLRQLISLTTRITL